MTTFAKMTQFENIEVTNIKFPYEIEISEFLNYEPLVDYFEDTLCSKLFAENSSPIYFPEFKFSSITAKMVFISNEINALTNVIYRKFDNEKLEKIISKYIELYTLGESYMRNESSYPIREDKMIIALQEKSYDCSFLCSKFDYLEKDDVLFNAMYKFCSKSY